MNKSAQMRLQVYLKTQEFTHWVHCQDIDLNKERLGFINLESILQSILI